MCYSFTNDNWAMRKIRDGRVKIGHLWFYPDEQVAPYDGRLDGRWCLFGRYMTGEKHELYVALWGTKEHADMGENVPDDYRDPNIINGYIAWSTWSVCLADWLMEYTRETNSSRKHRLGCRILSDLQPQWAQVDHPQFKTSGEYVAYLMADVLKSHGQ